jgi:sigma-E factor negative regulatory protein RseC
MMINAQQEPTPLDASVGMQEEGRVVSLQGDMALVSTTHQDACAGCSARGACHTLGGGKERQVAALNRAGAKVGDRVLVTISRSSALGAGFLAYLAPVLALLIGAFIGKTWGPSWGWGEQNAAVVLGLAALASCWMAVRWLSGRMARDGSFSVEVTRVLGRGQLDAVDQCSAGV